MPTYKIYKTVDEDGPTKLVAEPQNNEELRSALEKIQKEYKKYTIFAVERNDGNCVDYAVENGEFTVIQKYRGHAY